MGKYRSDDFEREEDYLRGLYYRKFSHEERESQRRAQGCSKATSEPQFNELPAGSIFRSYPDH